MAERYCCAMMKLADEERFIDYTPHRLTTVDIGSKCYPINYCPFCGTKLEGTEESIKRIKKYFGKKKAST